MISPKHSSARRTARVAFTMAAPALLLLGACGEFHKAKLPERGHCSVHLLAIFAYLLRRSAVHPLKPVPGFLANPPLHDTDELINLNYLLALPRPTRHFIMKRNQAVGDSKSMESIRLSNLSLKITL